MTIDQLILRIKRSETPFFRFLKRAYTGVSTAHLPVPGVLKPLFRSFYNLHFVAWFAGKRLLTLLYREPLFRSRCDFVGERLSLALLPEIIGHAKVVIGDNVSIYGKFGVFTGRTFDVAELRIGNRVTIGHQVIISCNRQIIIEDDVYISGSCMISDNDGHPLDMSLRISGHPAPADRTFPVRICRGAWIGAGSFIMKGVTIGEGGIVGANSVVTRDVPAFTVVAGNPAVPVKELQPRSQADMF